MQTSHTQFEPLHLRHGGPLVLGMNYRLSYGWDFGRTCGGEDLSLNNPARLAMVKQDFAELAAHGVKLIRWFVFNDCRNGIIVTGQRAAGVTDTAMHALHKGLDAAHEAGLHVLLVLLDHTMAFDGVDIGDTGMHMQGRGDWLKDEGRFEALVDHVLGPVVQDLAGHPAVMGYELVNEPEMMMELWDGIVGGWTGAGSEQVRPEWRLSLDEMRERMWRMREVVHANSGAQFSIGAMSARWAGEWADVLEPSRDFLTFHYYGHLWETDFERTMEKYIETLTRRFAVGLGEFYPNGARVRPEGAPDWPDMSLEDFLRKAEEWDLQLAMPWVWRPGQHDPGPIEWSGWDRFRNRAHAAAI
jgi:hypothetical protein